MFMTVWIIQGLLGLLFVITGCFKFFQSREKVIDSGGTWAEDFAPRVIKVIAGVELLSGLAVILPRLVGAGIYLIFIGSTTIALIMIGAIFTHLRRKEYKHALINVIFLLMALFVAYAWRPGTLDL